VSGVVVAGAAAWMAGRWLVQPADLSDPVPSSRAEPDTGSLASPRLARADRLTRMVAMTAARALACSADPSEAPTRSVLFASTLASAHTNEAFEATRLQTGRPVPRQFPYTAPNAAAGELASAIEARGPSLSLVGGTEVALAALERACRWLATGSCHRAVVVAAECPPERTPCLPTGFQPVECAAALVLDRRASLEDTRALIDARWASPDPSVLSGPAALRSVAPLARLVVAWHQRVNVRGSVRSATGSIIGATLVWP
jgi:hypothetical protein